MGLQTILFVICLSLAPTADNREKVQKKELEAKVRTITAEAQKLEKAGQLAEARSRYYAWMKRFIRKNIKKRPTRCLHINCAECSAARGNRRLDYPY